MEPVVQVDEVRAGETAGLVLEKVGEAIGSHSTNCPIARKYTDEWAEWEKGAEGKGRATQEMKAERKEMQMVRRRGVYKYTTI
jgi:hypothetical protein